MRPSPKPTSAFRVELRDLPVTRQIAIEPAFVATAVAGMPLREALGGDHGDVADGGEADLELYADGTTVFVQGAIRGTVAVACSRCVGPVAVTFDERVRVTYVPAAELPADDDDDDAKPADPKAEGDDEGVELTADELDVFPYEGDAVDLEPLAREQFVLAVPFAPLCREDCRGLCPQCGIDRNTGTCSCVAPADPRFAALANMKLPS